MDNSLTLASTSLTDEQITQVFAACFESTYRTRLVGGASEPFYQPACAEEPAVLRYREDFAASALHESAHWCLAGARRRSLPDFGLVYIAPPRSPAQQQQFFDLELRTQTLESLFAAAAGVPFQVSADNLDCDIAPFAARVADFGPGMQAWLNSPVPGARRARCFHTALWQLRTGFECGGSD